MRKSMRLIFTLLLPVVGAIGLWFVPQTTPGRIPTVNAYGLLAQVSGGQFPYSGTAIVTFTRLPWYLMPTEATPYAGRHQLLVHFMVMNRTHFHVDIETIQPVLESGTLSVTVNGREISSYDSRTNTAGRSFVPPALFKQEKSYLLDYFQNGLVYAGAAGPTPTIQRLLATLRAPTFPLCFGRSAHIVRQQQVLGRTAVVIDYGPLSVSTYITGCSFSHPGHCVHHTVSSGWSRVWVDRAHPFVLKYAQYGMPNDPHNLQFDSSDLTSQVTSVQYGVGPTNLRFYAPVPVVNTSNWIIGASGSSTGGQSSSCAGPAGFLAVGTPRGLRSEGENTVESGPLPRTTAVDALFSTGQRVTTYTRSVGGAERPFGLYVAGPYVLVQQRVQAHGLPVSLQTGSPQLRRGCRIWSGKYADGQRWAAFARGTVSVLVSTNTMSASRLLHYTARKVCAP
jgi:hypothetical protein